MYWYLLLPIGPLLTLNCITYCCADLALCNSCTATVIHSTKVLTPPKVTCEKCTINVSIFLKWEEASSVTKLWYNTDPRCPFETRSRPLKGFGSVPHTHTHTHTHAHMLSPYLLECASGDLGRRQTTDICSLHETFTFSPVKKKHTQGFYYKCFITSLRGRLAWLPIFLCVCDCVCVCVCERTCKTSRTPAVLWQPVLVSSACVCICSWPVSFPY